MKRKIKAAQKRKIEDFFNNNNHRCGGGSSTCHDNIDTAEQLNHFFANFEVVPLDEATCSPVGK